MTTLIADLSMLPNPFVNDPDADPAEVGTANIVRAVSFRDRRLVDIVNENAVSVRLANSIAAAAQTSGLPFDTIGDYLDAADDASAIMCRTVRNFGAKTARELAALVHDERARHPQSPVDTNSAEVHEERRAELFALFDTETIGSIIAGENVSVRLANVLARPELRDRPLTDIFDASVFTIASMMRISNLGRKSIDEFRLHCARLVARRFRAAGFDLSDCEAGAETLLGGMKAADLVVEAFEDADMKGEVPDHSTVAERVDCLLAELEPRSADILRRRFGISQASAETLEEIGVCFAVTRERIRQIEAKAIRRLQKRMLRAPLRRLLQNEAAAAWSALSPCGSLLLRDDLNGRKRLIEPRILLALELESIPLAEFIDGIAAPFPLGWHVSESRRKTIEEAARRLSTMIERRPLPRAAVDFDRSLDRFAVEAACKLILGLNVRQGYVAPARVGARVARAIGLHAILATRSGVLDLLDLLSDYHRRFPHDLCTARDAEIVMRAASHLFVEIEERRWLALGSAGAPPPPPGAEITVPVTPEDPGTIARALQDALRFRGPTRLSDLFEHGLEILPEGRSINSIGPVLLTRHELFVRLLPGVYGLPEHLAMANAVPEGSAWLFNDYQARLYCLARQAGEPLETFPLWTTHTEYRFGRWARHSGGPGILSSLLQVADIRSWTMSDGDKEQWLHLKERIGRFELGGGLRENAAYERPELERVLAACVHARANGSLNWFAANRICGRKLDAHGGAGMLALLVRLGALSEPVSDDFAWQRPHSATPEIGELVSLLENELLEIGELSWDGQAGDKLVEKVANMLTPSESWVDAPKVNRMLAGSSDGLPEPEDVADPIEEILAQHRRNLDTERREARLQWLLADA